MTAYQIKRVISLDEKAMRHSNVYKKLSKKLSAQSKAAEHLRKAERLYSEISDIIRDINSAPV